MDKDIVTASGDAPSLAAAGKSTEVASSAKPEFCAGCGKELPRIGQFYTFFTFGDQPAERTCFDEKCVDLRNARFSEGRA